MLGLAQNRGVWDTYPTGKLIQSIRFAFSVVMKDGDTMAVHGDRAYFWHSDGELYATCEVTRVVP